MSASAVDLIGGEEEEGEEEEEEEESSVSITQTVSRTLCT